MTRQIITILSILFLLTACNASDENSSKEKVISFSPEKEIKDAITKFPDSFLLKEKLIQYYRDSAAYEQAIATVNEAIKKDSSNPRSQPPYPALPRSRATAKSTNARTFGDRSRACGYTIWIGTGDGSNLASARLSFPAEISSSTW